MQDVGLKKIEKSSTADLVCKQMRDLINNGQWAIDSRLPSEAALAETFQVNRLTVRIALQRLNALGVIETKNGEGSYVRHFDFDAHMASIESFYSNPEVLSATGEFRSVIEVESMRMALRRPSMNLSQLREACLGFESAVSRIIQATGNKCELQDFASSIDESLKFHSALCDLSGNPLMIYAFDLAKGPIRRNMIENANNRVSGHDARSISYWVSLHWEVFHALEARDFEVAKAALLKIINVQIY